MYEFYEYMVEMGIKGSDLPENVSNLIKEFKEDVLSGKLNKDEIMERDKSILDLIKSLNFEFEIDEEMKQLLEERENLKAQLKKARTKDKKAELKKEIQGNKELIEKNKEPEKPKQERPSDEEKAILKKKNDLSRFFVGIGELSENQMQASCKKYKEIFIDKIPDKDQFIWHNLKFIRNSGFFSTKYIVKEINQE